MPGLRRGAGREGRARRRDARQRQQADRCQRNRLPRGLLHALPRDLLAAAVDPLPVRQRPGRGHRHRRGTAGEGPRGRARGGPGRRRGNGGYRLRLPVGDVRAQRRRALRLLRQRGVHEHRRAALRRHARHRAHHHHARRRRRARQRLRAGQEPAADRHGARDPLRGHGDDRRPARPRVQGRARHGDARSALPARVRDLPSRLGLGLPRQRPHSPPCHPMRAVPGVRGRARGSRRRVKDPAAGAGRGVPQASAPLRAPLRRPAAPRRDRPRPGDRRPQHRALRARGRGHGQTRAATGRPYRAAPTRARGGTRRSAARGDRRLAPDGGDDAGRLVRGPRAAATARGPCRAGGCRRRRPRAIPIAHSTPRSVSGGDGEAVRDHARRRLEPRQQDGRVAHGGPLLRAPAAALQQRMPGRGEHPGLALPRGRGRLRGRLARADGGQPAPGHHGKGLLPPVRDGLQPGPDRRGRGHQLRGALPR